MIMCLCFGVVEAAAIGIISGAVILCRKCWRWFRGSRCECENHDA